MYNICVTYGKKYHMLHMCVCIHAFIHTCLPYVFELMFNMCWKITHDLHMIHMSYTYVWSQHMWNICGTFCCVCSILHCLKQNGWVILLWTAVLFTVNKLCILLSKETNLSVFNSLICSFNFQMSKLIAHIFVLIYWHPSNGNGSILSAFSISPPNSWFFICRWHNQA